MLANPTVQKLTELGLATMAGGLAEQLGTPGLYAELTFEDRLGSSTKRPTPGIRAG
jgi:hypothetical protein